MGDDTVMHNFEAYMWSMEPPVSEPEHSSHSNTTMPAVHQPAGKARQRQQQVDLYNEDIEEAAEEDSSFNSEEDGSELESALYDNKCGHRGTFLPSPFLSPYFILVLCVTLFFSMKIVQCGMI